MHLKIINFILVLLVVIVFYFGLIALFNMGMIEKNQINAPNTQENNIYLSVETRVNEIESVRTLINWSFLLGFVVIIKLVVELFTRRK